jgi:hypothetical protein
MREMACAMSEGARAGIWLVVADEDGENEDMVREEERCTATAGGPDAVWLMSAFFVYAHVVSQAQAATGSMDHRGPPITV